MTTTNTAAALARAAATPIPVLDIASALGYEYFTDCEFCDWRIRHTPSWNVFFPASDDYKRYNHSIVLQVEKQKNGKFLVTVRPWARKPGDPELVELEDVHRDELRMSDSLAGGRLWHHVSPNHPEYKPREEGVKVCTFPSRKPRCPQCQSLRHEVLTEPYGDRHHCPECGRNVWVSIGD